MNIGCEEVLLIEGAWWEKDILILGFCIGCGVVAYFLLNWKLLMGFELATFYVRFSNYW